MQIDALTKYITLYESITKFIRHEDLYTEIPE